MAAGSNYLFDQNRTTLVQRAVINTASSGNNTLVAAVTGKKIRVLNIVIIAAGSVVVNIQSGAGGTSLTGPITLSTSTGFGPGFDPTGHFETADSTLLNINLGGAVQVSGWLNYILV